MTTPEQKSIQQIYASLIKDMASVTTWEMYEKEESEPIIVDEHLLAQILLCMETMYRSLHYLSPSLTHRIILSDPYGERRNLSVGGARVMHHLRTVLWGESEAERFTEAYHKNIQIPYPTVKEEK